MSPGAYYLGLFYFARASTGSRKAPRASGQRTGLTRDLRLGPESYG